MARKRKPENETTEAAQERRLFESISNIASRSEKTSWNRKMDNMVKLLTELEPVEQKILDIILKEKLPIMDQVEALRLEMIRDCIHPYDQLMIEDTCVYCKFCNRLMAYSSDV